VTTVLPHALPYVLFVAIGAATGVLGPWADAARVILAAATLAWCARRGAYPELRARSKPGVTALAVIAGLAIGVAWVPLSKLVPTIGDRSRTELDPWKDGVLTTFRIVGMVAVVPFAEELLVRSALPRFADAKHDEDWRALPVGAFTRFSAGASIVFFTMTHPEWLAALVTGLVWTALLAKTRDLRALVVSHAVANAWLAGHVLVTGEKQWW
jgi:CAAX prenyl protease-like protein